MTTCNDAHDFAAVANVERFVHVHVADCDVGWYAKLLAHWRVVAVIARAICIALTLIANL